MTITKIIDGLYFTIGMILFNPINGENKTPDQLNEDDRTTYDACMGAIALLKAQEPRVLTLEEVRDEADHMYLEKHSKTGSDLYGCAIRGDWDGYGIELLMGEYDTARERWSDYGKAWRCWTSHPTDEQREATPWK